MIAVIIFLSLGSAESQAASIAQKTFAPSIWQDGTPGDCGGSQVLIKKVESTKLAVQIDVTTECFGGGRSNGFGYTGEAQIEMKNPRSAAYPLGEASSVVPSKEDSPCVATLKLQNSKLKLDFKNCAYNGDGVALQSVELKPLQKFSYKPSFRCASGLSVIEQTLCSNKSLAEKDVKMSALFQKLKKAGNSSKTTEILKSQRQWLESRNSCLEASVQIERCLENLYDQRLKTLSEAAQ